MYDRPDYPSGPIVNYLRLLPRLAESGYKVYVLVIYSKDYPNGRILQHGGIIVHATRKNFTEPLVKWILDKVEEIQPHVFIPDVSTPGCFAGIWVMKAGIPVITSHRSDDKLNWGKALYFSDPKYGNVLSGIVCVNRYLESTLINKIKESPILRAVIPSGVPVPDLCSDQQGRTLKIVYAGRLIEKQKRIHLMIDAFLKLCEKNEDVLFTIIGDGPEKEACISKTNQSRYSNHFKFTGKLLDDKYKEELSRHHVIVLLSDYEGTPGSIMDGMSCGLVPVCLAYNGIDELIMNGKNGFVVRDREDSFFNAVEMLYQDGALREKLSKAARQTIVDNYSLQSVTAKWINFVSLCLEKTNKRKDFIAPLKIQLPFFNPLLVEDKRLSDKRILNRLLIRFPQLKRLKDFLFTQER